MSLTLHPVPPQDWPALAQGFRDHSFEQSLTYGQAAAARIGGRAEFLALRDASGQTVAAAVVRIKTVPGLGRGIAWIASGPLTLRRDAPDPDAPALTAILTALRGRICAQDGHILRLRLPAHAFHDPKVQAMAMAAAGFAATERAITYRSAVIDMALDQDQLFTALHGKWRNNLRFSLKAGLAFDQGDDAALQARFLALYRAVQTTKGFQVDVTPEFHFALSGPDYCRGVLIVTQNGTDLAGAVICRTGDMVTYLFGATPEVGRSARAGYALTWEAIAMARRMGARWYDLGGIDETLNPEVARFKDRMNGLPLFAQAYETDAGGSVPRLIRGLEGLRSRLRARLQPRLAESAPTAPAEGES